MSLFRNDSMNDYTVFCLFKGAYYGLYAWSKNTLVISVS